MGILELPLKCQTLMEELRCTRRKVFATVEPACYAADGLLGETAIEQGKVEVAG